MSRLFSPLLLSEWLVMLSAHDPADGRLRTRGAGPSSRLLRVSGRSHEVKIEH
jgi:hypothetical protein